MGVIKDEADVVYRDHVIDGVPSSGPHKVVKGGVRDLFETIEDAINEAIAKTDAPPASAKAAGATEGVDASTVLTTLAASNDLIRIEENLTAESVVQEDIRDVTFVGEGSLTGVYRKFVIPDRAGIYSPPSIDLTPAQVSKLTSKTNPVVVLVGDSISTFNANTTGRQDTLTMQLERACRNVLTESQSLTFYNRAINGMTYAAFYSGATTTDPSGGDISWWDDGTVWRDQVEALNADIIFLSFGMNDGSGILPSIVDALLDEIASWTGTPQVVLCSNMQPSLGANPTYATRAEQDNRDMAAGVTRTMAKYRGIGLLDMHRTFCAARDGFDPCRSTVTSTAQTGVTVGSQIHSPEEAIDFVAEFTVDLDDFVEDVGTSVLTVKIGTMDLDWFRVSRTAGDLMRLQLSSGPGATPYNYVNSTMAWPGTGEVTYRVEVKNNIVTLYRVDTGGLEGTYSVPLFTSKIVRGGGWFTPAVFMASGGTQIFSDTSFYLARQRVYKPTIRDKDLFAGTDGEGSAYNHPGNYISAHIYTPTIEAVSFGPAARIDSGVWVPTATSVANLDSTPTIGTASFVQVGDQVFGSFRASVDPTAAAGTLTSFRVTLPVPSAFTSGDDAGGTVGGRSINQAGAVSADATNDQLLVEFPAQSTASTNLQVMFRYTIK